MRPSLKPPVVITRNLFNSASNGETVAYDETTQAALNDLMHYAIAWRSDNADIRAWEAAERIVKSLPVEDRFRAALQIRINAPHKGVIKLRTEKLVMEAVEALPTAEQKREAFEMMGAHSAKDRFLLVRSNHGLCALNAQEPQPEPSAG